MYNQHWSTIWKNCAKRHAVVPKFGITDDGRTFCNFYYDKEKVCHVGMSKKGYGIYINLHNEKFKALKNDIDGVILIEKCFCCSRKFHASNYTVWPATRFHSRGNWGSTIIDMFNSDHPGIEIWICDVCLTRKKDEVVGYHDETQEEAMRGQVRDDVMEWYNNA